MSRSVGVYPSHALSTVQAALLEEGIKQMELVELHQQIEEDSRADMECEEINAKARKGQHLQEVAQQAREAMAKQLDRQRQLQKVENELTVAKLVTSFLQEQEDVRSSDSASLAARFKPLPIRTGEIPAD